VAVAVTVLPVAGLVIDSLRKQRGFIGIPLLSDPIMNLEMATIGAS
jgi:hypothetical protein